MLQNYNPLTMVKYIFACILPSIQAKLFEKTTFKMETSILDINALQIFSATHFQQFALKDGFNN
jgi:ABC-type antimicrobial peptide transport system permease subunit